MVMKQIKGSFFLLIIALITAFGFNHFSPYRIAIFGQWQPSKGVVNAVSESEPVNASIEINSPEIIEQMIKKKQRIILDVRPREFYDQGHLPGALPFPLEDFDSVVDRLLQIIHQESPVLVYCSGFECTDSHHFAQKLKNMKFTDVKVYPGGFTQWQEMGYEIEKTKK